MPPMNPAIRALIAPRSIAILGASNDLQKLNGRTLKFLIEKGYAGKIYPVNPKYERISHPGGELRCYPTVGDIPDAVDMAIITVPARFVIEQVRALGRKGVPAAIIYSSGFGEMGEQGHALEDELVAVAREGGVRLCGPNCLGLVNAFDRVIATFSQYGSGEVLEGPVGFVTQSGAFGSAIATLARRRHLGLGYFVNTGNECDATLVVIMDEVLADPRIKVGCGYIEGFKDGPGLLSLAERALDAGKPIVVTKVGRSQAGARAAASHTGSLAGEDRVFDGLARQFGIIRARNEEHMLDMVDVLAHCSLPEGTGIGLVTQSGGAGVLIADRAEELGLSLPTLSDETQAKLREVLPAFGSGANPVDVTAQFIAEPEILLNGLRLTLADPSVHVGIVWILSMDAHAGMLVELFRTVKSESSKPFVLCWVAASEQALKLCREAGIPVLRGAEPAVDAVAGLIGYAQARRAWLADRATRAAVRLPELSLPAPGVVGTLEATQLLDACGVSSAPLALAADARAAASAAAALGWPVAVKIESRDILHKTEVDGVRLGLADGAAVSAAAAAVLAAAKAYDPQARIDGVLVQKMATGHVEFVIGLKNDPSFGPVLMAGLGGILVEVMKDVAFRRCPVTPFEAGAMLDELRGRAILSGARGKPPVDRAALVELLCAVSRFGAAAGGRLDELDLNPVLLSTDAAVAVDCVMVLL
ncbi:MAG: acetate--CoA ligase family protein [Rhodocyclaceae bacterium]|nr:acetate--CoA ligase family protein [Rhodocyclaceae bacterium]MCA3091757.1 acetate--CoA ligase family protein [Rhodocyclaceae bacterium]MCA3093349.1 acetate--CoA ligase family protein [Rhodocyclaceae bacterium]MCA3096166.1 acetate--CoA ligase family protein [Rhodocyclaceae bacterium]MCA3101387.1 acetate--CoA ligase family protein [Rhodocyclaceae bacterium]